MTFYAILYLIAPKTHEPTGEYQVFTTMRACGEAMMQYNFRTDVDVGCKELDVASGWTVRPKARPQKGTQ